MDIIDKSGKKEVLVVDEGRSSSVEVGERVMPADLTWRAMIESAVERLGDDGVSVKEGVVSRLVEIAMEGNESSSLKAIDMLFERLDGKVAVQGSDVGNESPFQAWIKGLKTGEQMMIGVKKESSE